MGGGYRFLHLKRHYLVKDVQLKGERDGEYYEQSHMVAEV